MKNATIALFILMLVTPAIADDEIFTIGISTDRLSYRSGEPVEITATLSNATATPHTSVRSWGCESEFWLEDLIGEMVADQNFTCLWLSSERTIPGYSTEIIDFFRWQQDVNEFPIALNNPAELVPPGTYRIAMRWQKKGVFYSEPFVIHGEEPIQPRSFIIPAVGNNPGIGGTQWVSDLSVEGLGGGNTEIVLSLFDHRFSNSTPATWSFDISNLASAIVPNVLDWFFRHEGQAALHVVTLGGDVHVSSRTYNIDAEGTYGQVIPAIPVSEARRSHLLPNLRHIDGEWRSNIGVINMTSEPVAVTIRLFPAYSSNLIPWISHDIEMTLGPNGYQQLNNVFAGRFDLPINNGFAWVGTTVDTSQPGVILAYASVIDNRTGDSVFVSPIPAMLQPHGSHQPSP